MIELLLVQPEQSTLKWASQSNASTGVKSRVVTPVEKIPLAEFLKSRESDDSEQSELNLLTGVKSRGRHTRREDLIINPLAEFLQKETNVS